MSKSADEEKQFKDQILEQFDLLFSTINNLGTVQQQMKQQMDIRGAAMDAYTAEQHLIAQQVKANGAAVAQLTMRQFDHEEPFADDSSTSLIFEEKQNFENVFAHMKKQPQPEPSKPKQEQPQPETSKHKQPGYKQEKKTALPHSTLPKMQFPKFDGQNPRIWKDNCQSYFELYQLPEGMWVTAAHLHFEGNAAKWYQAYKQNHTFKNWNHLCEVVEEEFGSDDFRNAMNTLLELKQTGTVEEYTSEFQSLQYDITMHSPSYDDRFFTHKYIMGLKEDIRGTVEAHLPPTVKQAATIARIQQGVLDRNKTKYSRTPQQTKTYSSQKQDLKPTQPNSFLWRDRQLRDYRKQHGLCFACGEKFVPGHIEVCTKRNKPQANALVLNDLDRELSDEVLNELAAEDVLQEEFCQLSLNAITSSDTANCIKLKTRVKNKVMLILIDSGSSHSFISKQFVELAKLPTVPMTARKVKLANGDSIVTDRMVHHLQWFCQGSTLTTDMVVLDMHPYDAILGFDWLQAHSPMHCDWENKTLQFLEAGRQVKLQGLQDTPIQLSSISATKVYNSAKGNDVWAFVLVDYVPDNPTQPTKRVQQVYPPVQHLLAVYKDVFTDPQTLPPQRAYDHAIPLLPEAIPINSKPYHYSPQHKSEIERQVQELLQAGLIAHSHSPFASPVLLVKKKDGSWRFCVDYRKLNDITIKNRFPMPIIEEILDELAGSKFFTKLDMRAGYHQVRMLPEDEHKTAFKTHQGHYQFKVMPFGLTNAPATFQCIMNHILQPFLRKFVLVFLDDILIYSATLEEHTQHLELVLEQLRKHQFFLKESKCSFAQASLEYLGHIISARGVATDSSKIAAMVNWPAPTTVTELRAFLGLTGYYRRFVKGYGQLTKPLTNLLKLKHFTWTQEAQMAFEKVKTTMTQTPVLGLPNFQDPFTVETDACQDGIGAVLMQHGKPIAYLSKALGEKHKALSIYEKEFLALIMAVERWRHYLQRQEFIIVTDHKSLAYLNEQNLHSELQRKAMTRLMGLQFKIVYRKGKENMAADALSRVAHLMALQAVSSVQPA